ncbi:winged helix-turn-helix domain-containing protein [Pseudoalteromonas sp. T1lg65]|uniref:winged helix-turn-helix domain-containing protein n=1 Tax=Pseudoalteromonas sp. T1lg65 TaxID=2077101 RepID=UPI003F795599
MKFAFKDFLFDSQSLALYKDEKKLNIKEKPAQILNLFLTEPETIHSKTDILEKVWPDRKVTDQVVFQNIGHLRALFGDDAIKTFSRKGYQWQFAVSPYQESAEAPQVQQPKPEPIAEPDIAKSEEASTPSEAAAVEEIKKPMPAYYWLAILAIVAAGGAYFVL